MGAGAPTLTLPGAAPSAPTGTLPLAPPGPAPERPAGATPTPHIQAGPAVTPVQRLPLAPVIQREGELVKVESNQSQALVPVSNDSDLNKLLEEASEAASEDTEEDEVDLEDLATRLVPYVKRLIAIERERQEPY